MNKKLMAAICAAATVASTFAPTVSVLADTIDSGTVYVSQEVYKVVLPTTATQKFYIDPEGLKSGKVTEGTWAAGDAGSIICDEDGMTAINNSSVPVALNAAFKLKGEEVKVATSADDAKKDKDPTIYMEVKFEDAASGGAAAVLPSTTTVALGKTASDDDVFLPAATYTFSLKEGVDAGSDDSSDYLYTMTADTGSGVKMTLSGACAKDADWSDYADGTNTVGLEAVFKFFKATYDSGNSKYTKGSEEITDDVAPTFTAGTNGFTYTSGSGKNAIASIDKVEVTNNGTVYDAMQTNSYYNAGTLTATSFTFDSKYVSYFTNGDYTATVTYTDGESNAQTSTVTVTFNH